MRCACIDIGSNTTRLLVAERGSMTLEPVHEERVFTRLGAALSDRGTLPETVRSRVIDVVAEQLSAARAHGAEEVHGVATAAIRRAVDGVEFVRELAARTGLRVRILSDREEARLAFRGAAGMAARPVPDPLGVVDVGGGSCEIVVGRAPDAVLWWVSLPLGSGTLAAQYLVSDPPTGAELAAARSEVALATERVAPPRPASSVAVGGSATTLGRFAGPLLDGASLGGALAAIAAAPAAEVSARYGIDRERVRVLPAGLVILEALARLLGGELAVGRGGVREGVLLEAGAR